MAAEHLRLIIVVYTSAIAPLLLMLILRRKKLIPDWVPYVYLASFIACAIGWELWFTYGWVDGAPVYEASLGYLKHVLALPRKLVA